jgi:hypothetical protein
MKCSLCDEEHASVTLSPKCHPGRPLRVSASEHGADWTLEMVCAKCGAYVATFIAKRVMTQ